MTNKTVCTHSMSRNRKQSCLKLLGGDARLRLLHHDRFYLLDLLLQPFDRFLLYLLFLLLLSFIDVFSFSFPLLLWHLIALNRFPADTENIRSFCKNASALFTNNERIRPRPNVRRFIYLSSTDRKNFLSDLLPLDTHKNRLRNFFDKTTHHIDLQLNTFIIYKYKEKLNIKY